MIYLQETRIELVEKGHKEYLKLNKNILLGFFVSVTVSAIIAQVLSLQAKYLNSTATLAVDLSVYYSTFSGLFYLDNKKTYRLDSGELDMSRLKSDLIKIITSMGSGEIVYGLCRWLIQYYLLVNAYEAYIASILAQSISFVVYLVWVNAIARSVKLYKDRP